MTAKKDYYNPKDCSFCDGGLGCKRATNPPISMCKKCLCFKCTRGKCQAQAKA